MRIHSDRIAYTGQIRKACPDGIYPEISQHASRKRLHAFEVRLESMDPGSIDRFGNKRSRRTNPGTSGQHPETFAATWEDWGDMIAELFEIDPSAIIGPYDGRGDFLLQTARAAEYRGHRAGVSLWQDFPT